MRHYLPRRGKRQGYRLRHQPAERLLAAEAERVERTAALLLILLVQRVFASRRAAERRVHADLLRIRRRFRRDSAATRQRRCGERDDTGQPRADRHANSQTADRHANSQTADGHSHSQTANRYAQRQSRQPLRQRQSRLPLRQRPHLHALRIRAEVCLAQKMATSKAADIARRERPDRRWRQRRVDEMTRVPKLLRGLGHMRQRRGYFLTFPIDIITICPYSQRETLA